VRDVISPFREKRSPLWKGGKWLKEIWFVVGKFFYKLLNGDITFPNSEVNFGKQILASHKPL
jgi:hypothetical protein